jgi:hypothetical protein
MGATLRARVGKGTTLTRTRPWWAVMAVGVKTSANSTARVRCAAAAAARGEASVTLSCPEPLQAPRLRSLQTPHRVTR